MLGFFELVELTLNIRQLLAHHCFGGAGGGFQIFLQILHPLKQNPQNLSHLPHFNSKFIRSNIKRRFNISPVLNHNILQQIRININTSIHKGKCICKLSIGGSALYFLFKFLKMFIMGFRCEMQLFDTIGQLLIVNLELEFRDRFYVESTLVHSYE